MTIAIDTSALVALLDASDRNHGAALDALRDLDGATLVITNYVVSETLSLAGRRFGMESTRELQRSVLQSLEIQWTTALEHASAVETFLESGRSVSFVDAATMATMRARGVEAIFAFDDDFARAGFATIPRR